ncbi:MAG TPA: sigma-70 family RNA polymerase sigma factor [Streptosporangiaceae bacterium]|nr:sigma-70 family RNA polymerase sigma factor [Streptosporangiaceae bacterium]
MAFALAAHPLTTQREELSTLEDTDLLRIVRTHPHGDGLRSEACETLIGRYQRLVRHCVRQYQGSPESAEELMQVGYVGLLKAINNFDPGFGGSLAAYAQPCVSGEIKRNFRDKRWQVHVRRSAQELLLLVRGATDDLTQRLGHTPTDPELARHLGIGAEDLRDARRADLVLHTYSLDAPATGDQESVPLADLIGAADEHLGHAVDMAAISTHWGELPAREQRILALRFYGNRTQAEIGEQLGISQMHVSRLLNRALGYLRDQLMSDEAGHSGGGD